ncbi:MAG TPA: hypothetical protein VGL86_11075 [Polyangia bacterium]|jgi:hypothetical protein
MYKLIRIALFALPLAGGAAWAQGSGTSGSAGAPGSETTPPVTDDTRTPTQEKAGRIDDTTPALPGDATKPTRVPNTVDQSSTPALPDQPNVDKKSDIDNDTSKTQNQIDRDTTKDQNDSDK